MVSAKEVRIKNLIEGVRRFYKWELSVCDIFGDGILNIQDVQTLFDSAVEEISILLREESETINAFGDKEGWYDYLYDTLMNLDINIETAFEKLRYPEFQVEMLN